MDDFMNSRWGMLAFLSVFHVIGGIALGSTFSRLVRNRRVDGQSLFFIVWGAMFGCMPLTIGASADRSLMGLQLGILAVAIILPIALGGSWRESFKQPGVSQIAFGGLFFVVGMTILGVAFRQIRSLPLGLFLFAAVFVGAGLWVVIQGLRKLATIPETADDPA